MSKLIRHLVREIISEISIKSIGSSAAELTGTESLFLRDPRKFTTYNDRLYTENIDFCDKSLDLGKVIDFMIGSTEGTKSNIDLAYRLSDGRLLLNLNYDKSDASAYSKYNDVFRKYNCVYPTEAELGPSGLVYNALKSNLTDSKALERQIKIASVKNADELMKTQVYNPNFKYYAITKCDNEFLYGLKPHALTGAGIGASDAFLYTAGFTNFASWLMKHPIRAYNEVGKEISDLPDDIEERVVYWLQVSSSILGIVDLAASFIAGVPLVGSIGPSLVLAEYYRYAKPDDKTFGVPTYAMHYVFAALAGVGTYGRVAATLKTGEEVADLAVIANNFSKIRNSMGLSELSPSFSQTAKIIDASKAGISYNRATLQNLLEFSKKFPEVGSPFLLGGGKFIKQGTGWAWVTEVGAEGARELSFLKNLTTGKTILFSNDVKEFIELSVRNQNTLARYIMWYNQMPGFFSKMALSLGFAGDTYVIGDVLSLWGKDSEIPVGEKSIIATPESVVDMPESSINTDFYTQILKRDSLLKDTIINRKNITQPTFYNVFSKQRTSITQDAFNKLGPALSIAIKQTFAGMNQSDTNTSDAKIILVDDTVFTNIKFLVDNPDYITRRSQNRSLACYRHSPGVYSIMMTSSISSIINR